MPTMNNNLSQYLDHDTGMAYTYDRDKVKRYIHQHGWPTEFGFKLACQLGMFDPDDNAQTKWTLTDVVPHYTKEDLRRLGVYPVENDDAEAGE